MAANQWFKFYGGEYLGDPKMLALTGNERSCWITLLSYASISEPEGMIKHLQEYQLMSQAGIDPLETEWEQTKGVLEKFKSLDMITLDNGVIVIKNWNRRQEKSLSGYERVKRWRDKNNPVIANDNDDNKFDNVRREEKRREENNTVTTSVTSLKAKRVRNTKPRRNPLEAISLLAEIKKLEDDPQRYKNIIALYLEHRKPDLRTWGQLEQAIDRHSKAAAKLKTFSDDQIVKGFTQAKKQTEEWTLETVMKQLTK